jgi:hypothetical protein
MRKARDSCETYLYNRPCGAASEATHRLKTIAGRLVRELGCKLSASSLEKYRADLALYHGALAQKRNDYDKIYSLHEPHIHCVALTKSSGIIVGAVAHKQNLYDGHTLPEVPQQTEASPARCHRANHRPLEKRLLTGPQLPQRVRREHSQPALGRRLKLQEVAQPSRLLLAPASALTAHAPLSSHPKANPFLRSD